MTPQTPPLRPAWLRAVGLVSLALGLSVFAWWPMLAAYPKTETYEGPYLQQALEAARVSVVRYHELPLWNTFNCGGVPLWDNPQGFIATPLVWPLLLAFDTTRVLSIWYVGHVAIGFVCMWILARHELGLSREGTFVAAGMWAFSGIHSLQFTGTGFHWAASMYMPLAIFLWRRAERDLRAAAGLAILMSLEFYGGAVYPIMLTTVMLLGETLTRVWQPARMKGIARAACVAGLWAFLLSAARLIPVIYQSSAHKRGLPVETDALDWTTLKDMFLARTHTREIPGHTYLWPEFGNYVGPLLLGLALIGLLTGAPSHVWVLVTLVWVFGFMLGHAGRWAPWHLLNAHVFPFKDMRVPSRFTTPVGLFLALFAGVGVDRIERMTLFVTRQRRVANAAHLAALGIGLVGVGDLCTAGYHWIADSYNGPPLKRTSPAAHLYLEGPRLASFVDQPRQNRGRFECWEEWGWERGAPLWPGDVPQARATDPTTGAVTGVSRTTNTFTADIVASAPTRVRFNTSFDLAWRTSVGNVVEDDRVLGVDFPAGSHHVVVKYWPRGLTAGFILSGAGVLSVTAYFVVPGVKRRRRRARER